MAFIPTPDTVRVTLEFVWASQIVAITLAFKRNDDVTVANMNDLLTDLEAWRVASLRPNQSNVIAASLWTATSQDSESAPVVQLPVSADAAGSIGSASVPNNSTLAITFGTDSRGRSFRGRNFIPGLSTDDLTSSVLFTTARATALLAAYAGLNTAIAGSGYEHVVISTRQNNLPLALGMATPITNYRTDRAVDSQRRRLLYRGE